MSKAALPESANPRVLEEVVRLAAAGPVDLSPLDRGACLFDLSDYDLLVISGRDRVRFLHAMLSNDVKELGEGQGRWATFNNLQGRTVADLRLFNVDAERKSGRFLALLEPGAGPGLVEALDKYVIAEKVFFEPDEGAALWLLAGPDAEGVLRAAGVEPPSGLLDHAEVALGGRTARVFRWDRSGAPDFGLWLRAEDAQDALAALGALPRPDRLVLEAGRVRGGRARGGVDFTEANIPLEAGLAELAISFTKGCYIGQEVICRIDSMGQPKQKLVRLDGTGDHAPPPGTPVLRDGKEVGYVTSSFLSADGPVALGYVKKRSNEPGTELELADPRGPLRARVGPAVGVQREA